MPRPLPYPLPLTSNLQPSTLLLQAWARGERDESGHALTYSRFLAKDYKSTQRTPAPYLRLSRFRAPSAAHTLLRLQLQVRVGPKGGRL